MLKLLLSLFVAFPIYAQDCAKEIKEKLARFSSAINKTIKSDQYFNLDLKEFSKSNQYQYLVFSVEATQVEKGEHKLFFVIQDDQSNNYWTQLNHVSEVQKGKFDIYVDLRQIVGERGSQKSPRRLNLKKLKKVYGGT